MIIYEHSLSFTKMALVRSLGKVSLSIYEMIEVVHEGYNDLIVVTSTYAIMERLGLPSMS